MNSDAFHTIGRGPDCGIVINHQTVSRRHAALRRDGDSWLLEDLGSKNGTWVNGARVDGSDAIVLEPGDMLRFAAVTARFDPDGDWPFEALRAEVPLAA
jgi:pSer/pThr/pTyr-binding forkhead associated (FHA) protein